MRMTCWQGSWGVLQVSPRSEGAEDELAQSILSPKAASHAASNNRETRHMGHHHWPDLRTHGHAQVCPETLSKLARVL